jgi:hypothetical protein
VLVVPETGNLQNSLQSIDSRLNVRWIYFF